MPDMTSLDRWKRLREVIRDLGDADSIEEVVHIIRISARRIAGADGITFVRREGDFVRYVAEDAVSPLWTGQRFPIDSCISGIAMLTQSPIAIPDVFADPRVPHQAYEPTFVKSMAMVPIGVNAKVAAIGAYWSRTGQIDDDTIGLLVTLARATAAVLEALEAADHAEQRAAHLQGSRVVGPEGLEPPT
jgi:GAF domain-containing protein